MTDKSKEAGKSFDKPKKAYQRPELSKIGSLRDLTQRIGTIGKGDGAKAPNNRTGRGGHFTTGE